MKRLLYLYLTFASSMTFAQGTPSCKEQAKTPMEQLYCDIKSKSPSTRLPNIHEFRKNPEKTQALLLKRPAKKLGLTIPTISKAKKKKRSKVLATQEENKAHQPNTRPSPTGGLEEYCQLNKKNITCGSITYQLKENVPNNKLAKGALLPENGFHLPAFEGNKNLNADALPYLEGAYLKYIRHMLKIGLGASVMSFTKLHHTFMEVQSKNVNFSDRMTKMFVYLKKDKASMGVKRRFNNLLPANLNKCNALSDDIIVCDNVKQTWIYQQI